MSTTHKQDVVAEAVCSALYGLEFSHFLGERDDPGNSGNLVSWFLLSTVPNTDPGFDKFKAVRVAVYREGEFNSVKVNAQWLNRSGDPENPLLGQLNIVLQTYDSEENLKAPATQAVVRVLEIYKDVLEQDGVAGDLEALAPEREEEADVEDLAVDVDSD